MQNIQRAGGAASLMNAAIAIGNIVVVFGVLEADVAASPERVASLVTTQPAPLLALEFFKIVSALAATVTVLAVHQRLGRHAARPSKLAAVAGIISAVLLLTAGIVGAIAITFANSSAGPGPASSMSLYLSLNTTVNGLGLAAVFANGIWYLLVSLAAVHTPWLPRGLVYLGVPLGVASLVAVVAPPAALLVLVLGLVWAVWLGLFLLREPAPNVISAVMRS